jgi:UDP-N-acetylglucosamine 2-epimerase
MLRILKRCWLVITDSGGLQEESPTLGKPVLILRDVTERPEVVSAGAGRLVGTDSRAIVAAVAELHRDRILYAEMTSHPDLFGDGHAAQRIADALALQPTRASGEKKRADGASRPDSCG